MIAKMLPETLSLRPLALRFRQSAGRFLAPAIGLGLVLCLASPALLAQDASPKPEAPATASTFSDGQKAEIEGIIKSYLLKNPELFLEIQTALEAKMEQIQAERLKTALAAHKEELFRDPDAPVAGNPKGDVTVVEFFDYNCGYCKRGFPDVAKLLENDTKVRVVFRELPILSQGSEEAARVAIAANMQGKYWEFHSRMIAHKGQANEASAMKIAEKAGLDMDRIKADMKSEKVDAEIKKVRELAQTLNINGTPHFIVGNRSIPGAPQDLFDQLKKDIEAVRSEGCTVC
ncbi:MAG: DsbA family protein [Hyphomicrobiaceae bacterium]|nr:DsbA family protein [Hyphomicrobiaceae bacterium]